MGDINKTAEYLDITISREFRETINSSNIFYMDKQLKAQWHLICAVMDRVDSCLKYFNDTQIDMPKAESELITFFTYADMMVKTVKELFLRIGVIYPYQDDTLDESYKYFFNAYSQFFCQATYCRTGQYPVSANECRSMHCLTKECPFEKSGAITERPTDDRFFEYLRTLAFAHPVQTNRHVGYFQEKGEVHYSPYVMINNVFRGNIKNTVGVMVYSNQFDGMLDVCFPFSVLKDYVKSRYELFRAATSEWAKKKVSEEKEKWVLRKVKRDLSPIEVLKDIREILKERYAETYRVDEAIEYLECPTTNKKNKKAVEQYRAYIMASIPALCDDIDDLESEGYTTAFDNALNPQPKKMHDGADYELEKIFGYLDQESDHYDNITWGLAQAKAFANSFAKDYVEINCYNMSFSEIKLLVNTACYLEKLNQEKGIVHSHIIKSLEEREKRIASLKVIREEKLPLPNGEFLTIRIVDASKDRNE